MNDLARKESREREQLRGYFPHAGCFRGWLGVCFLVTCASSAQMDYCALLVNESLLTCKFFLYLLGYLQ